MERLYCLGKHSTLTVQGINHMADINDTNAAIAHALENLVESM